jgi:1-acyl-sn-glycerol-3-phosphate acyltransferase
MLRGLLAILVFAVLTAVFGSVLTLWGFLRPSSNLVVRLGRVWSRSLLATIGARVRYHGLERIPRGPCILLSNHASVVDIWVLFPIMPEAARFVAKEDLFRTPFMGWALRATGFVPIDRTNRTRAIRSLEQAAGTIRAGRSVVMFPEGTRSTDGRLLPFKKGAFHLALAAGVPVVPITIRGAHERVRARSIRVRPGSVDLFVDDPIDVAAFGKSDTQGLSDAVRAVIEGRLAAGEHADAGPRAEAG